jgi:RNA polymerase sigma-70 factor (ECF subfamily)
MAATDEVGESSTPRPIVAADVDFDTFFRRDYPKVVALIRAMTGSAGIAEDLAQETFTAAHLRWSRVRQLDRPDLWVRRVALNRAIGVARRRRSEPRALGLLRSTRSTDLVTTDGLAALDQSPVLAAVRGLPTRQRQLVCLVYLDDRTIEDAAGALGLSASTARTHLLRARSALAAGLGTDDRDHVHQQTTEAP